MYSSTFHPFSLRSWTLSKPYGIKRRCYWEHLGECIKKHFWNLGILWGLDGNTLGTRGKKPKKKKKKPPPHPPHPTPPPKGKKPEPIMSACWAFSLAAWNFLFFKTVYHHFWPGLIMAGAEIWGTHWEHREHVGNTIGTHLLFLCHLESWD